VAGFGWYVSTADLAAVRAQAKAQGMATSWAEFRPGFRADPAVIAQFTRLEALSRKLKDYDSELITGRIPGDQKRDRLRPFWPVPAAAREFHANLDQAVVAEALAIIDAWPEHRLMLSDGNPRNRVRNRFGLHRQMIRWTAERVLLADDEHAIVEVRRLLRLLLQMEVLTGIDVIIEASIVAVAAPIIADQLPRLNRHADELVALLSLIESRLLADLRAGIAGFFVELWLLMEKPADGVVNSLGMFIRRSWWDPVMDPLRVRAGRAPALECELERDRQLAAHGLGYGYVRWLQEAKQRHQALRPWHPGEWFLKEVGSNGLMADEMTLMARLQLQLLIAEIRGDPWPMDLFDPTGQPLRRLTRDGQMIGAYSVGMDQRDDGGDRQKDRQFPLFGAWVLPPPPEP
jgi:hypothetical protein